MDNKIDGESTNDKRPDANNDAKSPSTASLNHQSRKPAPNRPLDCLPTNLVKLIIEIILANEIHNLSHPIPVIGSHHSDLL